MTLHIFNPEHDLALASNVGNFTAPHAARMLKAGLGFLPALWADDGDAVLVEDSGYAEKAYQRAIRRLATLGCGVVRKHVRFFGRQEVCPLQPDRVDAWGWDTSLRNFLLRYGISRSLTPTLDTLDAIRNLSHRATAQALLTALTKIDGTVGEMHKVYSPDSLSLLTRGLQRYVLKAPWSSSGRGVRFIDGKPTPQCTGWIRNTITAQGCLMLEPYYRKVKDFGMEFASDGQGGIAYKGLSLFHTVNGAYAGNIIATERAKEKMLERYAAPALLHAVREKAIATLSPMLRGHYKGPLGIDMMIVAGGDHFLLHPCVEINLRDTMGHVALRLSPTDDDVRCVMRIETDENFLLTIQPLL